jgi:hypothetical protein
LEYTEPKPLAHTLQLVVRVLKLSVPQILTSLALNLMDMINLHFLSG